MKTNLIGLLTVLVFAFNAQAETSLSVRFNFFVPSASQQSLATMAPILNSVLVAGQEVPTRFNSNVKCNITLTKFDSKTSFNGAPLSDDTVRVEGVFQCEYMQDTMALAPLLQQMSKWLRADISNEVNIQLNLITPIGPSVSGSN
jgi:hypothetical protein